jgi:hypothetical protein
MPARASIVEDFAALNRALLDRQIASRSPGLIAKCAIIQGKVQGDCQVCNDPQIPCVACVKKRDVDYSTSECPICWQTPTKSCPSR